MPARRPRRLRFRRLEGTWYRLVREGRDPMDFARTRAVGGRYNPPGMYPVLYLGDQPATCLLEVLVHAGTLEAAYELVPVDLRLDRVVDLATEAGRKSAGVSLPALVAPPEAVRDARGGIVALRHGATWNLGARAHQEGADGILVPSAAIRAQQVLVLFDRPGPKARVRVRRKRRLLIDPRMRPPRA